MVFRKLINITGQEKIIVYIAFKREIFNDLARICPHWCPHKKIKPL
jgi:hypothetical protein